MKDDKDLIDQIAKDMAFYDSLGRPLDVAVIMGAHRDAAKTVIKLVRRHDRERLQEAIANQHNGWISLDQMQEMVDGVFK